MVVIHYKMRQTSNQASNSDNIKNFPLSKNLSRGTFMNHLCEARILHPPPPEKINYFIYRDFLILRVSSSVLGEFEGGSPPQHPLPLNNYPHPSLPLSNSATPSPLTPTPYTLSSTLILPSLGQTPLPTPFEFPSLHQSRIPLVLFAARCGNSPKIRFKLHCCYSLSPHITPL